MENSISIIVIKGRRVVIKLVFLLPIHFDNFSRLLMVFVIKRLNYIEFRVFWKGKEK